MDRPSNLCRLPWTGFSNDPDGRARPCCLFRDPIKDDSGQPMYVQNFSVSEIFHSKYMKDLREQFRNNERPAACQTCWTDEDNGYESKRLKHINDVHFVKNNDLDADWETEPVLPKEYQMIISNSCNLKCRSCTPSHSTQWQSETKALTGNIGYFMPHKQAGDELGKLWTHREEWYGSLKRLEVVGGEPFYVKQWHEIFEELISSGKAKDTLLDMSTNCTLFFPELLENICNEFKFVGIGLSVDGIGGTYEYLRHPGKWNVTYGNMGRYHDAKIAHKNLNIQVSYTISWLNALELTKMHKLVDEEFPEFKIWNNIVHYPEHMALWAIPKNLKEAIAEDWDKFSWNPQYKDIIGGIKTYMFSRDIEDNKFIENLQVLKNTDKYRKEDLLQSIPALAPYIKDFWNNGD